MVFLTGSTRNNTPLLDSNCAYVGPQGPRGETGSTGPTGPTGPTGGYGDIGQEGSMGSVYDGPSGPLGNNGSEPDGPQGPQGPANTSPVTLPESFYIPTPSGMESGGFAFNNFMIQWGAGIGSSFPIGGGGGGTINTPFYIDPSVPTYNPSNTVVNLIPSFNLYPTLFPPTSPPTIGSPSNYQLINIDQNLSGQTIFNIEDLMNLGPTGNQVGSWYNWFSVGTI
jgi:hypothetical protein